MTNTGYQNNLSPIGHFLKIVRPMATFVETLLREFQIAPRKLSTQLYVLVLKTI